MGKILKNLMFSLLLVATVPNLPIMSQSIPPHPDENICRCKHGGCYGGNAFSLRPRCGQGSCSEAVSNCPGHEDESEEPEG